MRIMDGDSMAALEKVTLLLTPEEARELADAARDLVSKPEVHHHHVPDAEFRREITLAVYTPENLNTFDAETKRVLESD